MAIPAAIVIGNPPDDPTCNLLGYIYTPPPLNPRGAGPYPGCVLVHAGGLTTGGPQPLDKLARDMANAGYLAMSFDVRLMKGIIDGEGGTGLKPPSGPQSTDGRYDQPSQDYWIGVRYLRAHPLCIGFVGGIGGSGSGFLALYNASTAIIGDSRLDAVIALSPPTDWAARTTGGPFPGELDNPHFVSTSTSYNNNAVPHGDLPTLLAQSPVALITNTAPPIFLANGQHEPMPFNQYVEMIAAMTAAGLTNFVGHINTFNGGMDHSFATWPENGMAAIAFMDNAYASWNGGVGGGRKPVPRGLLNLCPAPEGHIGDISAKSFLTKDYMMGCRIRLRWKNIQSTSKSITGVAATDVITSAAHGYVNDDAITLLAVTGGAGLSVGTVYYVISSALNTFKLSATVGGAAVNFTTDISAGSVAVFDWSELDDALSVCAAHGKKVGVSINITSGAPDFVYTTAPTCTNFPLSTDDRDDVDLDHMALIWQTGYLSKAQAFINAFGARYDAHPFISYVNITGPGQIVELHYIHDVQADFDAANTQAIADGHPTGLVDAWLGGAKILLDYFFVAFPTTTLLLNHGNPFSGTTGQVRHADVDLFAYGRANHDPNLGDMESFLHASLPPHDPAPVPESIFVIGKQPIHGSTFAGGIYFPPQPDPYPLSPQPLEDCLLEGITEGMFFCEVYEGDVENSDPAVQQVLKDISELLVQQVPPPPDPPQITDFTPTEGHFLDTIQIHGLNFTNVTDVLFGGVSADSHLIISPALITAVVSAGAVTGPITVTSPNGNGVSAQNFTVLPDDMEEMEAPVRKPILLYPIGGRPPGRRTRPDPVTNLLVSVTGLPGDFTAIATWQPPINTGNSPITGYNASLTPGGSATINPILPTDTSATIVLLTPDTLYTFNLGVQNLYGPSDVIPYEFRSNPSEIIPPPPVDIEPRGAFMVLPINPLTGFPMWIAAEHWGVPAIDGSVYEARWDLMQPTDALQAPDFTDIDAYLDNCDLYTKGAIINISGGIHAPAWCKALAGSRLYDEAGPEAGTMNFPWDTKGQRAYVNFLRLIGPHFSTRTCIKGVVIGGFSQTIPSVLADNATDAAECNASATFQDHYPSAGDAWLISANTILSNAGNAFLQKFYTLACLELPIPIGTPLQGGDVALDNLAVSQQAVGQQQGFMARGLTTASTTLTKRFQIVSSTSRANFATGYRFLVDCDNPNLDPAQPPSTYDPLTGFTSALAKVVSLNGKFVEIFPKDVIHVGPSGVFFDALTAAKTAMAAIP